MNNGVDSVAKIEALRATLRSKERNLALRTVPSLSVEERKTMFSEWIHLARCAHSPFHIAWNVLESLPRDWVVANIEKEVDAILRNEEETDYWMFLQLYARLDRGLMHKLAQRAASHIDAEIKELGVEYLAKP